MPNKKVLKCLEQNVDGLELIQNLIFYEDPLEYSDLMTEINIDHFEGYESLLPILLLSTPDIVVEQTSRRLLLQLYCEKLQEIGGRKTVDLVMELLEEEKQKREKRMERINCIRQKTSGNAFH